MSEDKEEIQMEVVKKVIEEYILSEPIGDVYTRKRVATIVFVDGKFDGCTYRVSQGAYTYQDWLFLLKVAQKIKELQEEKGGLR